MGQWPNGSWVILDLGDILAPSPERLSSTQRGRHRHRAGSGEGPSTNGLRYDKDGDIGK